MPRAGRTVQGTQSIKKKIQKCILLHVYNVIQLVNKILKSERNNAAGLENTLYLKAKCLDVQLNGAGAQNGKSCHLVLKS